MGGSVTTPDVSIIVPVHNDEGFILAALDSCLAQSWENIEVICVDDASTDGTAAVIEEFRYRDSRVRLLRQEKNRSAFQARRVGIAAARAPYVLFLDGDDELLPDAVRSTLLLARSERADVVGFGVSVVKADGSTGGRFERTLQPPYASLEGEEILTRLFPIGAPVQGPVWKYLWSTELLRKAYAKLPKGLELYRANDIPVTFLALASASRYVSLPDRLLRYFWGRGSSGHAVEHRGAFEFYMAGLTSIDAVAPGLEELARDRAAGAAATLRATYESARLSIIGTLLRYWSEIGSEDLQEQCLRLLGERAGYVDILRAAVQFCADVLIHLARHREVLAAPTRSPVRTVLLVATDLAGGGAQGVVVSQAKHLVDGGYRVVIGTRAQPDSVYELPPAVEHVWIGGPTASDRLGRYLEVCREYEVDVAIDHWVMYREDWAFAALAAGLLGVRTIGWLHNFALRPLFDGNSHLSFLDTYLPLLWKVVTLSDVDVAFWTLRGIENVFQLPNPPSPLLMNLAARRVPREIGEGPIHLVWWGRLQQSTKRVRDLVEVVAELRALDVDVRLTIIGPDSKDLSAKALAALAAERGVAETVALPGPLYGDALYEAVEGADLFVYTSAIEGYSLTLVEAQQLGLPVAMYELPWLSPVQNNHGVVAVPQQDVRGLAQAIAAISRDPARYRELSAASTEAAAALLELDVTRLYTQLLEDELPARFSSSPRLEDARILLDRAVAYAEQRAVQMRAREDRLRARIAALDNRVEELSQLNDRLSDKSRRQRARVVELTQWKHEHEAGG